MGYTHFDKVSGKNGLAVGKKGAEIVVSDSEGNLYQKGTQVAGDVNSIYITAQIADISTAGSTFVVLPACTVTNIWTVIDNAITGADATITFKDNGGTALTGGSITIAYSGSAAGDIDTCAITAHNTFTEGQKLEIITDGGSTDACLARVTIKATRTA